MARRHTSGFEVIGMSQDPTPGDPDGIRLLATRYAAIGDQAAIAFGILGQGGAVEQGKGEAMDKLREALESLPDKLSKTAESFQAAVRAYNTYATQLEDAQGQVDTAMDNALAVAATATRTLPELPADATGEQRDAARGQQNDIDAAQSALSAARRMAEDARSLREQASARTSADLDAAAANAIPERNFFQKIGDFFKDFPFVQIIINALVAIVSIFFPVIGLALGALVFVLTQVVLGQNGEIRLGDLLLGIVTLIPGVALFKLGGNAVGGIGRALPSLGRLFGKAGGFFTTAAGKISSIKDTLKNFRVVSVVLDNRAGRASVAAVGDFAARVGEEAVVRKLNGDEITAKNLLLGAAVGGALTGGGAFFSGIKKGSTLDKVGDSTGINKVKESVEGNELLERGADLATNLGKEGIVAGTKVGVAVSEGSSLNEALLHEGQNLLAGTPGSGGARQLADGIPSKGSLPSGTTPSPGSGGPTTGGPATGAQPPQAQPPQTHRPRARVSRPIRPRLRPHRPPPHRPPLPRLPPHQLPPRRLPPHRLPPHRLAPRQLLHTGSRRAGDGDFPRTGSGCPVHGDHARAGRERLAVGKLGRVRSRCAGDSVAAPGAGGHERDAREARRWITLITVPYATGSGNRRPGMRHRHGRPRVGESRAHRQQALVSPGGRRPTPAVPERARRVPCPISPSIPMRPRRRPPPCSTISPSSRTSSPRCAARWRPCSPRGTAPRRRSRSSSRSSMSSPRGSSR